MVLRQVSDKLQGRIVKSSLQDMEIGIGSPIVGCAFDFSISISQVEKMAKLSHGGSTPSQS